MTLRYRTMKLEEYTFAMKLDQDMLEKALYWACWLYMAGLALYLMVTYL